MNKKTLLKSLAVCTGLTLCLPLLCHAQRIDRRVGGLYLKINPSEVVNSPLPGYYGHLSSEYIPYYSPGFPHNYHSSILELPYTDNFGPSHPTSKTHWGLLRVERPLGVSSQYCLDNVHQSLVRDQYVGQEIVSVGIYNYSYDWAYSPTSGFYEVLAIDKTQVNMVRLDMMTQCDWLIPNGQTSPNGEADHYYWENQIWPSEYSLMDYNQNETAHSVLVDFEHSGFGACYYLDEYGCESGEICELPEY